MLRYSKFFSFVHHYLRPLWNYTIKGLYFTIYKIKLQNEINKNLYKINKTLYDNLKSLDQLNYYMRKSYKYKYDGPFGILDHDNSDIEFFTTWGDCDDVAKYALKYIEKNTQVFKNFYKIGLKGNSISYLHFDVYFEKENKCYLFNYGRNIVGNNLEECLNQLETKFNSNYSKDRVKYWICRY